MKNEYAAYNNSYFVIYLPKIIKLMDIWRSSDTNSLCSFF